MSRLHPRERGGFTLIEILVVVVILGIAGAIIVPQIGSRDDLKAAAAARMLMSDLIYAQNASITLQTNHCVVFSVPTSGVRSYQVVKASDMLPITHPVKKEKFIVNFGTGGTPGLREASLNTVGFTGDDQTTLFKKVGFDELGTPLIYKDDGSKQDLSGGSLEIQCGQQKLKIEIEPYTGQITVKEP